MNSPEYEQVIGLEIHAQLRTKSKLFCGCSTEFGRPPNSLTCPICLGLPGALPVLNKEAVRMALMLALALKALINLKSEFSRKNYFYPDLPKGYQITQYHVPIAEEGRVTFELERTKKTVGIERIHIEEDAGKSVHDGLPDSGRKTNLDFNRCGVPLLEIVGKPEINSPQDAVEFLQELRTILLYLEICDGNMEEGSLRCDANISVRKKGAHVKGTKIEIKNLNSFRFLAKALEYETERQVELLEAGNVLRQETRLWDMSQNKTVAMRSKEEAHDYRYFPEPDLPPLRISPEWIKEIQISLPELPQEKIERFVREYGIPAYDAKVLSASRPLADYFEKTAAAVKNAKAASNWIMREVLQYLKETDSPMDLFPLSPEQLGELICLAEKKEITLGLAKEKVFPEMIKRRKNAGTIIQELGLSKMSDEVEIRNIILRVIEKNPAPLQQYREGKAQVFGFFVGQVMKETKGSADPQLVNTILKALLDEKKNQG